MRSILNRPDTGHLPDDPSTTGVFEGIYNIWQGVLPGHCPYKDRFGRNYCESQGGGNLFQIGFGLPIPTAAACQSDTDCSTAEWCAEANCSKAPMGTACQTGGVDSAYGGTDLPCRPGQSEACFCTQTDDSRWKFVIAHEAGHQVEERGIGALPNNDYTFTCPKNTTCTGRKGEVVGRPDDLSDPPLVPQAAPYCSCEHVASANGLHCLQSIERGSAAQGEGFGQFFSSRMWNRQNEADCKFGYYKEFLDHTCDTAGCTAAGDGFLNRPPIPIDCVAPHKWRNRNCAISGDMSTEIDWMGLLYNLNVKAVPPSPMTDIWNIYRQACLPPPALGTPPNPNPPVCAPDIPFNVGWEATTPGLAIGGKTDQACLSNTDCSTGDSCCEGFLDSVQPCAGGVDCKCKTVTACASDADCSTGSSCRDDAPGSALPCSDGTCLCKVFTSCTQPSDCKGQTRCRDTSAGFPPCAGANCACIRYDQTGFLDGAKLQYVGDSTRIGNIAALGDIFGVSRNLAP